MKITKYIVFLCLFFFVAYCSAQNATVGGLQKGHILRDSLLAMKKIEVNKPYQVVDYTVTFIADVEVREFRLKGNVFTSELKQTIKNSKKGDRFCFEEIRAMDEKGIIYKLQSIMLTIK